MLENNQENNPVSVYSSKLAREMTNENMQKINKINQKYTIKKLNKTLMQQ
jgi:hypothetical protein